MAQHTIKFCNQCKCNMIVCGTCGNNCCNGGSGTVDGKPCPDCDNAYAKQKIMWAEEGI